MIEYRLYEIISVDIFIWGTVGGYNVFDYGVVLFLKVLYGKVIGVHEKLLKEVEFIGYSVVRSHFFYDLLYVFILYIVNGMIYATHFF